MRRIIILIVAFLFLSPDRVLAERSRVEYRIKASMVFNFIQFITWPQYSPSNMPPNEINVCKLGNNSYKDMFLAIDGRTVLNKVVRFTQVAGEPLELSKCEVLVLDLKDEEEVVTALRILGANPVVTIGEIPEFLRLGGIIQFEVSNNRVVFNINHRRAEELGLSMSSKLLRLAREIY